MEPHLVVTYTNSLPPGLYWRNPIPASGAHRGDIVIACVPDRFAAIGFARGFLEAGLCNGVEPVLKRVAARAGDSVELAAAGVRVNLTLLPGSGAVASDGFGRTIPHVAYRRYRLSPGEYWLTTPKPNGFDSRYFGIVRDVRAVAFPLVTFDV